MDIECKIKELETKLKFYEENGIAKLYYALLRKSNEMGEMLNKTNLVNLDLTDAKDKSFERLKVVWNDAASIANAIKEIGISAGITGDEEKDVKLKRVVTTPESIAENIGNTAGKNM
jgi:metal-dependent HD superfamily phosphatase/phosphodiesterase